MNLQELNKTVVHILHKQELELKLLRSETFLALTFVINGQVFRKTQFGQVGEQYLVLDGGNSYQVSFDGIPASWSCDCHHDNQPVLVTHDSNLHCRHTLAALLADWHSELVAPPIELPVAYPAGEYCPEYLGQVVEFDTVQF